MGSCRTLFVFVHYNSGTHIQVGKLALVAVAVSQKLYNLLCQFDIGRVGFKLWSENIDYRLAVGSTTIYKQFFNCGCCIGNLCLLVLLGFLFHLLCKCIGNRGVNIYHSLLADFFLVVTIQCYYHVQFEHTIIR